MAKYVGTVGDDDYTLHEGKREVVRMLGGDDTVHLSAASFGSDDRIAAGPGRDTAVFQDGGFYNLGHDHFTGFEDFAILGEGVVELYLDDSVVAGRRELTIVADGLLVDKHHPSHLFIDGAPERHRGLRIHASAGDDVLIGGGSRDDFYGLAGNDLMTGNEGADTFIFEGDDAGDHWGKDRVTDFRPGEDHLMFVTDFARSFDDLLIERTREGAVIRTPGSTSSVTLLGVLPGDLDASDVSFSPAVAGGGVHAPAFLHDHGLLV